MDQPNLNNVAIALSSPEQTQVVCGLVRNAGFTPEIVENASNCKDLAKGKRNLLLIIDSAFDGLSFNDLLTLVSGSRFVFVSAKPRIEEAVEVMKNGGLDYLCQPVDDQAIRAVLLRASQVVYAQKIAPSSISVSEACGFEDVCHFADTKTSVYGQGRYVIVSANPSMKRLLLKLKSVAKSKASVLIMGESGTGKELLARYIHAASDRANGPFVALNCAALPETLLESELFGHEKGAFSGAFNKRLGKFEQANGGTILLDEITEMSTPLQAKLLRVLQEGEIDRLGGASPVKVNVRVIATTNRDILATVKEGRFREDLYYRLNVIPVTLPGLRERPEDIEMLARYFLQQFATEYKKDGLSFASGVLDTLKMQDWQGNIRELRNVMERGVLLAQPPHVTIEDIFGFEKMVDNLTVANVSEQQGDVKGISEQPDQLDQSAQPKQQGLPDTHDEKLEGKVAAAEQARLSSEQFAELNLAEMEKNAIRIALSRTEGNRTHAANLLGISVRTLRNKLAEYRQMGIIL